MSVHLVVGGNGTIGSAVAKQLHARGDVVYTTSRRPEFTNEHCLFLDLAEAVEEWVPDFAYDTLFLCAGHDPGQCLEHPEESRRVNVTGPFTLAERAVRQGAFVVKLSTNAIFDGSTPCQGARGHHKPASLYGKQHSEADTLIDGLGDRAAIVRFSKVVGPQLALFRSWVDKLIRKEKIRPLQDLHMAPVSYPYIVDLICRVGLAEIPDIFQASGRHDISYAAAAARLARKLGVSEALVEPATMAELGIDARGRAEHTTLDMAAAKRHFGIEPQDIDDALAYLVDAYFNRAEDSVMPQNGTA